MIDESVKLVSSGAVSSQAHGARQDLEMNGKVVIVTGASRGIGRACLERFHTAGATVVGCSRGPTDFAAPTGREEAARLHFRQCDVSLPADVEALVDWTVATCGQLDCLVNNAGYHPPHQSIDKFSVADFQELLTTNLVSMFSACKAALPHLRRTHGTIVNMGSNSGVFGQDGAVTYSATKAGISGLTKALAIDEAAHGVRVNCVSGNGRGSIDWGRLTRSPRSSSSSPAIDQASSRARISSSMGEPT
jgi:NAD(P)-dependent dehydrogenase (short-subunit alcohol dehydrogenase family)